MSGDNASPRSVRCAVVPVWAGVGLGYDMPGALQHGAPARGGVTLGQPACPTAVFLDLVGEFLSERTTSPRDSASTLRANVCLGRRVSRLIAIPLCVVPGVGESGRQSGASSQNSDAVGRGLGDPKVGQRRPASGRSTVLCVVSPRAILFATAHTRGSIARFAPNCSSAFRNARDALLVPVVEALVLIVTTPLPRKPRV